MCVLVEYYVTASDEGVKTYDGSLESCLKKIRSRYNSVRKKHSGEERWGYVQGKHAICQEGCGAWRYEWWIQTPKELKAK